MDKPPSRTALLAGLAVAVVGLILSVVLAVGGWPDGSDAGGRDFGAVPGTSAPETRPGARGTTPEDTVGGARVGAAPTSSEQAASEAAPTASEQAASGSVPEPVSLALPRLGLRAPVDPVGVARDGQVEVPGDPGRVGWYRFSPAPGASEGSAVMVGHVDSDGRGPGVLVALNDVRRGDRVRAERADGSSVEYRVTARRSITKKALVSSEAFRLDGPAVLTLITCTGPYLPDEGGYQNNLVVTAVEAPK
ncbi:class F sortase [Streptomyces sp. NPDC060205]|uniref:class F sortase n=1 Tax=Streptomyces sp. NPDC060205 TaxID=3347072 RepID=UPI0036506E6C